MKICQVTQQLYKKAKKIIPGGTDVLSKRPEMFLPQKWSAYYERAKGCEVWDLDGNHYYDTSIMGVGANVLGYTFDEVDKVAKQAIDNGGMCTLNAPEEVYLSEKLLELHPWADMVRYTKTGGEAMAMAARIVRAYTGKDIILVCGYHGWHDWYLAANLMEGDPLGEVHLKGLKPLGVPNRLAGTTLIFHYNNIEEFHSLVEENRGKIAAVIMEPIRNEYPLDNFLKEIRKITIKENILLVFDEITAGFRLCCGGSHLMLGVTPDIAIFAKAMTNGYPLAAIVGKENCMQIVQETFISSTFWTERIAFAATLEAITFYESKKVDAYINRIGQTIQEIWQDTAKKRNVKIKIGGIYPLSHFSFEYENSLAYKTYFTQEMLKKGFLATTAFYVSYAHAQEVLKKYAQAFDEEMEQISYLIQSKIDIKENIFEVCQSSFERLN